MTALSRRTPLWSFAFLSALALLLPAGAASAADAAPATFKVGEFTFTRPAKWAWLASTSQAAKVHLHLTGPGKGETADVWFFDSALGTNNYTRRVADRYWNSHFQGDSMARSRTQETNVAGHKVTYLDARPRSEIGMPRPFELHRPRSRDIHAFVESERGNVLVRILGKREVVGDAEAEFRKVVESGAATGKGMSLYLP